MRNEKFMRNQFSHRNTSTIYINVNGFSIILLNSLSRFQNSHGLRESLHNYENTKEKTLTTFNEVCSL